MTKHNFHIFEYTLRRKDSIKHIEKIRKVFPNIVLGAGSVLERKTITSLTKLEIDFVSPGVITTRQPKKQIIYQVS